jgi:serine/threonine protein kinase
MTLTTGSKLGPYKIQSPLGAGGMGEVYRARDTRLDCTVAVKILPSGRIRVTSLPLFSEDQSKRGADHKTRTAGQIAALIVACI